MSVRLPITLAHHVFPQISITANPNYEASDEPAIIPPIQSSLTLGEIDGGTHQFVIELYIKVDAGNNPRIPYSLDVVCAAQARLDGEIPKTEDPQRMVAELGHKLLFPAVRELILSLTARQPWGQFSIGLGALSKPANASPGSGKKTAAAKPTGRPVHAGPARGKPSAGEVAAATAATSPAKRAAPRSITSRKTKPA